MFFFVFFKMSSPSVCPGKNIYYHLLFDGFFDELLKRRLFSVSVPQNETPERLSNVVSFLHRQLQWPPAAGEGNDFTFSFLTRCLISSVCVELCVHLHLITSDSCFWRRSCLLCVVIFSSLNVESHNVFKWTVNNKPGELEKNQMYCRNI